MRSFPADPAASPYTTGFHLALTSFADEVCGTLARLIAYLLTLALLAVAGIHLWEQSPGATAMEPSVQGWGPASRSAPAFAVSQIDSRYKTEAYEIFRHPQGGRRDVLRWTDQDRKPVAELEIYRPGGEESAPVTADITARMEPGGARELEAAGMIDSKFGSVTLLRPAGSDAVRGCLGFLKRIDEHSVQISGWNCQGANLSARRAAIGCMLSRLMLLTAGSDLKLAELFARAELRRGGCAPSLSADWVMGAESPRLRGAL